jgi:hypothetical protein
VRSWRRVPVRRPVNGCTANRGRLVRTRPEDTPLSRFTGPWAWATLDQSWTARMIHEWTTPFPQFWQRLGVVIRRWTADRGPPWSKRSISRGRGNSPPRFGASALAALTRSGARKASEIVMLTLRTLHFCARRSVRHQSRCLQRFRRASADHGRLTPQACHASPREWDEHPEVMWISVQ